MSKTELSVDEQRAWRARKQTPEGFGVMPDKAQLVGEVTVGGLDAMAQTRDGTANGTGLQTRLLPQRSLDGRTMDVVEMTRATPPGAGTRAAPTATTNVITIDIDAATYVVRRVESPQLDARGATVSDNQLTVTAYAVLPLSAVPTGVFFFTPPPGMTIQPAGSQHLTGQH